MYIKLHKIDKGKLVAVCDSDILGKKFSDKELELDADEDFYKGEDMKEDDILKMMKNADILNIVGKKAVNLALRNDIILKQNIIKIKGIPHAQRI